MASLSQTEKGLLRSNPCEIALNPTSLITADGTKDSSDCIFFVVESLTDKKAAGEAALHPNGILDTFSANYGESKCDSIYNYLTRCGITLDRNGLKDEADLIETLKNCNKGVIILFDTGDTKIVNNKIIHISHIMIITGLAYEEGRYEAMVYDTRKTTGVNNDVITGKEIIADLNLSNSVTWVIE